MSHFFISEGGGNGRERPSGYEYLSQLRFKMLLRICITSLSPQPSISKTSFTTTKPFISIQYSHKLLKIMEKIYIPHICVYEHQSTALSVCPSNGVWQIIIFLLWSRTCKGVFLIRLFYNSFCWWGFLLSLVQIVRVHHFPLIKYNLQIMPFAFVS